MGEKSYFIDLRGFRSTRIRVYIKTELGQVVDLVIQLEILEKDKWHAVARYDCAHGFPHLDLLSWDGQQEKRSLAGSGLEQVVHLAIDDFKANYRGYIRRFHHGQKAD